MKANLKTIIHCYNFNTRNENEAAEYAAMCERIKGQPYAPEIMTGWSPGSFDSAGRLLEIDGREIELEIKHIFSNQWNTGPIEGFSEQGLRVFDWHEEYPIHGNKAIKRGHWLEIMPEMAALRETRHACGYCGAQYDGKPSTFCGKCIGSEYLTEDALHLLRLMPVSFKGNRPEGYPAGMLERMQAAQKITRANILKKSHEQKLADLDASIAAAEIERAAFECLIEGGIDFENVIYYKHTGKFSFGWRRFIPESERPELIEKLKACGFADRYEYEFHKSGY